MYFFFQFSSGFATVLTFSKFITCIYHHKDYSLLSLKFLYYDKYMIQFNFYKEFLVYTLQFVFNPFPFDDKYVSSFTNNSVLRLSVPQKRIFAHKNKLNLKCIVVFIHIEGKVIVLTINVNLHKNK